mgnify:CR=1 FL=1
MQRYAEAGHINVGTGEDLSIRELAELVRRIVHPGAKIGLLVFAFAGSGVHPDTYVLQLPLLHGQTALALGCTEAIARPKRPAMK